MPGSEVIAPQWACLAQTYTWAAGQVISHSSCFRRSARLCLFHLPERRFAEASGQPAFRTPILYSAQRARSDSEKIDGRCTLKCVLQDSSGRQASSAGAGIAGIFGQRQGTVKGGHGASGSPSEVI
jgi:hypothetical protein